MYSNWAVHRQCSRLARACRLSSVAESSGPPPPSPASRLRPLPPPRVPRGPTDILQALAATVGHDPTAAHYKYHDDPYLTPLSNFRKRSHALAQEAGRKAAVWVRDQHPELFTERVWDPPTRLKTPHHNAEPQIPAYAPKPIYNDESKVTVEDLRYTIEHALVEDSVTVLRLLGGAAAVGPELAAALLQLLCFYREREPDSHEWLEERWFAGGAGRERHAATWKTGGLAEEIFNSLKTKDAAAYCAIIQGMAKYYQAERAYVLSREALEAGVTLSTETYNSLLGCVGFLKEGVELRTQALRQLLSEMQEQGLSPTAETLSACLRSVAAWGGGRSLRELALQLLAECRALGVQPSLAAYYHLLCTFCKERGPKTNILSSIMDDLERRERLEAVEPTDTNFFITALAVCNEHLQDMALAERVHALLMKGDNYRLVGDAFKESIYYRHLITVACRNAPLEKTTLLLDQLVPNVYVPEPSVMDEIIKALEVGGAGERLAQAWSQMLMFGHARRTKLLERLLAAMSDCYPHQEEEVKARMRAAAAQMLRSSEPAEEDAESEQRTPPPQLSASALCCIVEMCCSAEATGATEATAEEEGWAAAAAAARRLRAGLAAGVPSDPAPLLRYAELAAARGLHTDAAVALSYLAECGFEEAAPACVSALATALNRPRDEVLQLLREPRAQLAAGLQPELLAVVDAYRLSGAGAVDKRERRRDDASSSSDSESDSDSDGDVKK